MEEEEIDTLVADELEAGASVTEDDSVNDESHEEYDEVSAFSQSFRKEGYECDIFPSLKEVLRSIILHKIINGVDVAQRIEEPSYRFIAQDQPEVSYLVSEMLAQSIKKATDKQRYLNTKTLEHSAETRKAMADEFALQAKKKIDEIKAVEHVTSYRDTVAALNKHHVPTAHNGSWHVKTLQNVLKRVKDIESERSR